MSEYPKLPCYFCPWFSDARQTCILEIEDLGRVTSIPPDCPRRRW